MTDSSRILVLYASTHGQTRKIAERVAATLAAQGLEPELHELGGQSPQGYAGVVVGASIHAGKHQKEAVEFARRHGRLLNALPTAFFSVSLAAADDDDESQAETQRYIDEFVDQTAWDPTITASLAGAILFSHYGVFERALMRLIMRHKGHGDVKWDQEFTDWDAVERFAAEFAAKAGAARLEAAR